MGSWPVQTCTELAQLLLEHKVKIGGSVDLMIPDYLYFYQFSPVLPAAVISTKSLNTSVDCSSVFSHICCMARKRKGGRTEGQRGQIRGETLKRERGGVWDERCIPTRRPAGSERLHNVNKTSLPFSLKTPLTPEQSLTTTTALSRTTCRT